jgi:hypothetical protein
MKIQQTVFLILFSFSMPALLAVMGGCDRLATDSGTTASGLRINASISQAVNGEILDFVRLTGHDDHQRNIPDSRRPLFRGNRRCVDW